MGNRIWHSALVCMCVLSALAVISGEEAKRDSDSEYHDGVPKGKVEKQPVWESKIFPGTKRDWWIYVPAQYDPVTPANVMVFQDGGGPVGDRGEMRAPVVFDNLIHKKEMPITIGVFINPGSLAASGPNQLARQNRAFEYDSVGDRFARFLLEEMLPEVEKKYKLTHDPAGRAICGQSSGGSCAFTVAWERPDQFGKVVSGIGSFTSLHGCNVYPDLIRKMEPKPIRIYMQDGDHDLDIYAGSWWHANMDMAAALRWSGYDYFFLQGHDGHSGKQLGQNFPEAMRWLWRKDPVEGKRPERVDPRGVFEVLIKGEGWRKVADVKTPALQAAANPAGEVFFLERRNNTLLDVRKLGLDGNISTAASTGERLEGLAFDAKGSLFAWAAKNIYLLKDDGHFETRLNNPQPISCFAINAKGNIYFESPLMKMTFVFNVPTNQMRNFEYDGTAHAAFCFTPDQGFLAVIDPNGWNIDSARVEADSSLAQRETFYTLQSLEGQESSGTSSAAVDDKGRLYVSSVNGIQIFDQGGRVIGILTLPDREKVSGMTFGGAEFNTLFVVTQKGLFARKLNAKGVLSCNPPVTPRPPQM